MPGIPERDVCPSAFSLGPLAHFRCSELSPEVQVKLRYMKKSWFPCMTLKTRPLDVQRLFASFAETPTQGYFLSSGPIPLLKRSNRSTSDS